MSTFGWSIEFSTEELHGGQGWAYYAWAIENRSTVWGSNIERVGKGYVGMEIERLKKIKAHATIMEASYATGRAS